MNGTLNILVVIAVAALVIARQFKARRYDADRRVWLLPLVLGAVALSDQHLVDPRHRALAVLLIAVGVVVEIALGSVWGWTARLWREEDGALWVKGTPAAFAAWIGVLAVRGGLYALGSSLGVQHSSRELMLALAVLLLVRGLVLGWRARTLEASYSAPVAR